MADGIITCTFGSTRSGKTTDVIRKIKKSRRAIAWDVKGEFAKLLGYKLFTDINSLYAFVKANPKSNAKISFQSVTLDHFDTWAKIAFAWAHFAPVDIIVDELSDVTNPGKARGWWGVIIRRVLCTGSNVYAISQRPASCETDSQANASVIHTGRLTRINDRKIMAETMDIPRADIDALMQYEFIERDMNTMNIHKGKTKKPR